MIRLAIRRTCTPPPIPEEHHDYLVVGGVIPNPDIEVTVDFSCEITQVETYQDTYVYRHADDERSIK